MIRKAQIEDCKAILGLINELAVYERAPEAVTNTVDGLELTGFGANPIWWCYVCEINSEIVGFALYYIRYSTWKGPRMYLEDLYIKPSYRRQQIGEALFKTLVDEAKEKKLTGVHWQVLDWNETAISFYKKLSTTFDDEWVNCSIEL